jgi:hypothetical protein
MTYELTDSEKKVLAAIVSKKNDARSRTGEDKFFLVTSKKPVEEWDDVTEQVSRSLPTGFSTWYRVGMGKCLTPSQRLQGKLL